ncbi:MAG: hypothetical protein KBC83_03600 [Candidatus Moranbacteria bacterium]|jgi:uncharacterized membrane-anchored protein YhcB (DUF1043 family)|nr:hypothetical protein [Candidatus Moranbacteria bacterium]MBP9801722.1 hypothetical protein [Candidatus Moranbacteria bacterium]
MRISAIKDSNSLALKRKIETEIMLLSSDMKKITRTVLGLQAENRSLENQKKRLVSELDRNASLLRTQATALQRISGDLAIQKRRLNAIKY